MRHGSSLSRSSVVALVVSASLGLACSSSEPGAAGAGPLPVGSEDAGAPAEQDDGGGATASGSWKAVSAGGSHTCGVDLSDRLWCWGSNTNGQLGDGTATRRAKPATVKGLGPVSGVDASWVHTCAATKDGFAYCWGENDGMQLGVPGTELTMPFCNDGGCMEPVKVVDLTGVVAVGTGARHSCAILASGDAYCWGFNDLGQLGNGNMPNDSERPSKIVGLAGPAALSGSPWHTCAATKDGKAFCWGDNADGNVGVATPALVPAPVQVPGLSGVSAISAGDTHTCLVADGAVHCFGANGRGQLGAEAPGGATPVAVVGPAKARSVTAGADHSCAVDGDGAVWCWGGNGDARANKVNGKIGQPESVTSSKTAVKIDGVSGAVAVTAGDEHTCALTASGRIFCWGSNVDGQLGADGAELSVAPREVIRPE